MAVSAIDSRFQFQLVLWYVVMAFGLLIGAMLLATNWFLAGALIVGMVLLVTVPYHLNLAYLLSAVTFSSAFIVPFAPGRPFVWEAAAFLAWSGTLVTILLKRFPDDLPRTLRRNRITFLGLALFSLVLLVNMRYHGVGLNVMGSSSVGGRYYVQQIACSIVPLVFAFAKVTEKWLPRLILIQWLLGLTFVFSDLAFTFGSGPMKYILYVIELPYDAMNFESVSMNFGIRRFQSLATAGVGITLFLLAWRPFKQWFGHRAIWILPTAAVVFGMSLLSGHRTVVLLIFGTAAVVAWAQRFFTARTLIVGPLLAAFILILTYGAADRMPLAVQRAISFLPGIRVSNQAVMDATNTLITRELLRKAGWQMIPDYLWMGRGYKRYADQDMYTLLDPSGVTRFVEMGLFYNTPIGLMVNTGIPGTLGAALFLLGGTLCAARILRYSRRHGNCDLLENTSTVLAGYWMAVAFFFIFIHGDSDMIMRTFCVHCGLLIACDRLLLKRELSGTAGMKVPEPEVALESGRQPQQ